MFLHITEHENVVTVSLNRPDVRNAFNSELIADLTKAFLDLSVRRDIRAIVLRGEGKSFCAGADLQMMQSMVAFNLEQNQEDADRLYLMFESIAKCPHPTIAKVHGAAFGGALGLIACCDVVICEEKTQLCFSEVKLGIVPAVISSFVLRKVAYGRSLPWMISGKVMTAQDAYELGIVHGVLAEAHIDVAIASWVKAFKEAGPEAVRESKKLLAQVSRMDLQESRPVTTRAIAERRVSSEGQEGLKSFLEKRDPKWRGSL